MRPICTRTALGLALLALSACGKPEPPEKERPPEPQAAQAEPGAATGQATGPARTDASARV